MTFKNILLLVCILIYTREGQGQFTIEAETDLFQEPVYALTKLIQLKSGYTMYLQIVPNDGIEISLFDAAHISKPVKKFQPEYGRLKRVDIDGIFEIAGDVVVFISEKSGQSGLLYRLIIDGENANLKETKLLGKVNKRPAGTTVNQAQSADWHQPKLVLEIPVLPASQENTFSTLFNVRKSLSNQEYAVATYDFQDNKIRIEVSLFDQAHELIKRLYFNAPANNSGRFEFIDMAISQDRDVFVVAYSSILDTNGKEKLQALFGQSSSNDSLMTVRNLPVDPEKIYMEGILKYNPSIRQLYFLASCKKKKKSTGLNATFWRIDPTSGNMDTLHQPDLSEVVGKSIELFGEKNSFSAQPLQLYIHKNGGFTIIAEDIDNYYGSPVTTFPGGFGTMPGSTPSTTLGDMAIIDFDSACNQLKVAYLPKRHVVYSSNGFGAFYNEEIEHKAIFWDDKQYKLSYFFSTREKQYLLMNDFQQNQSLVYKGKISDLKGVGAAEALSFSFPTSKLIPERKLVFSGEVEKEGKRILLPGLSDYNADNHSLATIQYKNYRENKGVQIVWLKPE